MKLRRLSREALNRGRILGLLLIVAAITFITGGHGQRPVGDADARIAFYRERIGGRGAYPAYARLGMAYLQKARETGDAALLIRAEDSLSESMKFQPSFEALRALAFLAMEQHRFEAALGYAREALDAAPSDLETQGILSDAYWALGERENATRLVRKMLASGENFAGLSRLAVIRFQEGDVTESIESIRGACSLADKESRPLDNRAWCYTQLGSYTAAVCDYVSSDKAYRQALSYIPNYYGVLKERESRKRSENAASCPPGPPGL